ncbi:MAG TPA: ParB/RepB/Spo0J family partition protein [Polyangia bacterium]|nr:ParB/RepB/Spo0J family partition protein [Polyangia bacterium]
MKEKPKALGRGLSALIPGASPERIGFAPARRDFFECAIEDVYPAGDNPRQLFDGERLKELADSIRAQGVIQPLVVRQRPGSGYTLIAGERRWRAAQLAGLKSVPVVVKDVAPAQAFELMLVENLQRADLNPIEEAEAYQRLQTDFSYTQEQLAARVGKERATVANSLRLLKLPPPVRSRVASGELSMGHARALLGIDNTAALERAAARVMSRQLSVRQTEELVRRERNGAPAKKAPPAPSASVKDLEQRLERALGTKVRLAQKSQQAGAVVIDYHSLDQLDGLLEKLLGPHR